MNFYMHFLKAQAELFGEEQAAIPAEEHCPICGQPTLSGQACAFCRLVGVDHSQ